MPDANWYQQEKNTNPSSRYFGTLTADISVPSQEDKEKERNIAWLVLEKYLPESVDASPKTAIDSTVKISITGVESYG